MPEQLWNTWFANERKKLNGTESRDGKRGYIHFDRKIPEPDETKTKELLSPVNVAKHSFYPFIRIDTRERRFHRVKGHAPGDQRRERTIKRRPIDFASHKDAFVFSWYAHLLSTSYEEELTRRGIGNHVIAYRALKNLDGSGKTNIHFAKEAFDFIEENQPCRVFAIDITKFYEEIDHSLLHQQWSVLAGITTLPPDHQRVFEAITDYRFVRKGRIRGLYDRARQQRLPQLCTPKEFQQEVIANHLQEKGCVGDRTRGIPQGAPISCVLANAYMLPFDTAMAAYVATIPKGFYQRYSDDILIVCTPEDAQRVIEFATSEIQKLKLRIKPKKTEHRLFITNEDKTVSLDPTTNKEAHLQYLGIVTDGQQRLLRHGTVARFQRRRNRGVKKAINRAALKRKPIPRKFLRTKYAKPWQNTLSYSKRAGKILNSSNVSKQLSPQKAAGKLEKLIRQQTKKK